MCALVRGLGELFSVVTVGLCILQLFKCVPMHKLLNNLNWRAKLLTSKSLGWMSSRI